MSRAIDSRVLELNAGFLLANEVAPLGVEAGRLALGMRDPRDADTIAAVRFATRMEVDPVAIDQRAWSQWRRSLLRLHTGCVKRVAVTDAWPLDDLGQGPAITIALSEHDVRWRTGPDQEVTFAAADHAAWLRLGEQAERGASARVVLLGDVVWELELAELPEDAQSLRRALSIRSPLRVEDLAWSLPVPVTASAAVRLGLVRRAWLDQRIAAITTALSPKRVIVTDEAGRRFDLRHSAALRSHTVALASGAAGGAIVTALIVGVAGLLAWPRPPILPGETQGGRRPSAVVGPVTLAPAVAAAVPALASGIPPQAPDQADHLALVGVVGRLPHDAVALVRPAWGKTIILRVGDSLLGWRLATIAADRVTLAKGSARRDIILEPAVAHGAQSR